MERWLKTMERQGEVPPDDQPAALMVEGAHGPVVHATNRAARLAGVAVGARVTDARPLCPGLRVDYADVAGDRLAVERLVQWMRRWAPWSAVDGGDMVLDTTGSDHLWGGEAAMLADMEGQLALLGVTARLAAGPTWGAAWAFARYGGERAVCHDAAQVAALPVAGLRLDAETLLLLRRLGLKTIGALMDIPRLSLARRFARAALGANPLLRLDQVMGRLAEPLSSPDTPIPLRITARLAEPVQDPTPLLPGLCRDVCALLAKQALGCRRLRVTVYRTDGEVRSVTVATAAPSRDAGHLLGLFAGKIEGIDPGYGFDLVTLEALAVEPLATVQIGLEGAEDALALPRLIDRLVARFGAKAVTWQVPLASHIPERSVAGVSALAEMSVQMPPLVDRPERLLTPAEEVRVLYAVPEGPPAQFIWRRQTHRVVRYAGPERIAPEWWQDRPGTRLRDYFKVEVAQGMRFWLYREGQFDDGRGGDPRWFLHGIFG